MENVLKEAFEKASPQNIEEVLAPLGVKTFPELHRELTRLQEVEVEYKRITEQKQLQELAEAAQAGARKELTDAGVHLQEGDAGDAVMEAYATLPIGAKRRSFIEAHLGGPLGANRVSEGRSTGSAGVKEEVASIFSEPITAGK